MLNSIPYPVAAADMKVRKQDLTDVSSCCVQLQNNQNCTNYSFKIICSLQYCPLLYSNASHYYRVKGMFNASEYYRVKGMFNFRVNNLGTFKFNT